MKSKKIFIAYVRLCMEYDERGLPVGVENPFLEIFPATMNTTETRQYKNGKKRIFLTAIRPRKYDGGTYEEKIHAEMGKIKRGAYGAFKTREEAEAEIQKEIEKRRAECLKHIRTYGEKMQNELPFHAWMFRCMN